MSGALIRAEDGVVAPAAASASRARSYLVCDLGGVKLGIEALAVQEITPLPAWTAVPGQPPLVAGVVDVRGRFVPIIDVAAALGLPPRSPQRDDVLVLVERDAAVTGIVVHAVRDVQPLMARRFETGADAADSTAAPPAAGFTEGLATLDGAVIQLLRLEAVLHPEFCSAPAVLSLAAAPSEDLAAFEERARALAVTSQVTSAGDIQELAVVMLEGERFGLPLSVVREFAPLRAVTPVPRAPAHVLGLINLRGETLPLVDPRLALGLAPARIGAESVGKSHVVVIENGGVRAGLVVDAVVDVRRAPTAELRAHTARDDRDPLRATWMDEEGLLGVLDAASLLMNDGDR